MCLKHHRITTLSSRAHSLLQLVYVQEPALNTGPTTNTEVLSLSLENVAACLMVELTSRQYYPTPPRIAH